MKRVIVCFLLLVASVAYSQNLKNVITIEAITAARSSTSLWLGDYGGTATSTAYTSLFWYPTFNGLRISEQDFYTAVGLSEYSALAFEEAQRITMAEEINAAMYVTFGIAEAVGLGVMLGALSVEFCDYDELINGTCDNAQRQRDINGFLIAGGIIVVLGWIPLAFIQNTTQRNIVTYGYAQSLAENYNASQ